MAERCLLSPRRRHIVALPGDVMASRRIAPRIVMGSACRPRVVALTGSLVAAMGLFGCGGSGTSAQATGVKGPSEVAAAPVSTPGANPFTATVGKDMPGVTPPTAAVGSAGGLASYKADLPGLYGGTRNHRSCDAIKLVNYLEQNPGKAAAWAGTLGIQTSQIRGYVSGFTDVFLRTDTRVTNHGYVNGVADPIQSVLEAGTAVFVDRYGRPVVKCYCGNPLTPPVLYTAPVYTGPLWNDFSAAHITIINQSTTIINIFTLYDPTNGMLYTKTPGLHGRNGPYIGPSTGTTTAAHDAQSEQHGFDAHSTTGPRADDRASIRVSLAQPGHSG